MLVLSRRPGERILIGDDIVITVVRFQGGTVRLGIEAPIEFPVVRDELADETNAARQPLHETPILRDAARKVSSPNEPR